MHQGEVERLSPGERLLSAMEVDRVAFQQVVLNLVRNAIDAGKENAGPQAELRVRRSGLAPIEVQTAVSDSGPGTGPAVAVRRSRRRCRMTNLNQESAKCRGFSHGL